MATKYIPVYNISSSVGRGCANQQEDVMLVQFFLSRIAAGGSLPIKPPSMKLNMDGRFDDNMHNWIIWFQGACHIKGRQNSIDGKLTPATGKMIDGDSTIMHLNASYRNRYGKQHDRLEEDGALPGLLKTKFETDSKKYRRN